MIILRPPERGQDLTINHPSQPIKLIGTAGALSAPAFFRGAFFRGPAGISFLYSKNFSAGRNFPSPPCCLVFPFPSLIFLFKEPAPAVLDGGENDVNTSPTALSSASVNFFYFFPRLFCLPLREAAASARREKEYIIHVCLVSSALFSFFSLFLIF